MSEFITDPNTINFQTAKDQINEYIQQKPEYARWKDFWESTAGDNIVSLIAGLQTYIGYQTIVGRREAYQRSAETRSANIAIASQQGYSVFRGRNTQITLTINTSTPTSYSKYQVIGQVKDLDLICLEDKVISANTPTELLCTFGEVKEETITVASSALTIFSFQSPNVSEDMSLYLNGTELAYSDRLLALFDNSYVAVSNPFGAVDIYYLNEAAPFYDTSDELKITYVEKNETSITANDVLSDEDGVTNVTISTLDQAVESLDSVKVNAPLYYETQYVVRARNDFRKIFRGLDTSFIDTAGRNYNYAQVELSYIKDDLTLLTEAEKTALSTQLESSLVYGVEPPYIVAPIKINVELNIQVNLKETTTANITELVDNSVAEFEKKFRTNVDLFSIENVIERESYIKNARVEFNAPTRQNSTSYRRGNFVTPIVPTGYIYEFYRHVRKSGAVEPTWPMTVGDQVIDNDVIWEVRDERTCNLNLWEANTIYERGQQVESSTVGYPYILVCVGTINNSSTIEPVWPETVGETIADGNLIWQCIELSGTPDAWQGSQNYFLGDIIVPTSANGFAYQAVDFRSGSDAVSPTWTTVTDTYTEDGGIEWITRPLDANILRPKWNEYTIVTKAITINSPS